MCTLALTASSPAFARITYRNHVLPFCFALKASSYWPRKFRQYCSRIVIGNRSEPDELRRSDRKAKASGDETEIESEKAVRAVLASCLLFIRASIDHRRCEERILRYGQSSSRFIARLYAISMLLHRRCDIARYHAADVRGTKRGSRAVARSRLIVS